MPHPQISTFLSLSRYAWEQIGAVALLSPDTEGGAHSLGTLQFPKLLSQARSHNSLGVADMMMIILCMGKQ